MAERNNSMDAIVALCRRRGFIWQNSEIYGGINGFWDYGPLGAELKRNLKNVWWNDLVRCPPAGPDGHPLSIVGLDSALIMNPKVWEASGHLAGFNDPMQMCRYCKKLYRADHVWETLRETEWLASLATAFNAGRTEDALTVSGDRLLDWARKEGKKTAPNLALVRNPEVVLSFVSERVEQGQQLSLVGLIQILASEQYNANGAKTPCPECGGELTDPKPFNLMFPTVVGATGDMENDKAYLRPETAQGIFCNFWNVVDTQRVKIPFGIGQIGKAFRNEVTPRNFTFRSREFEQMEVEFFIHPSEAKEWYEYWRDSRFRWWQSIGLAGENLQLREHDPDELAHYAKEGAGTSDVEYRFPFTAPDFGELEGISHRTDYDLRQHAEHAGLGEKAKYFDQPRNERYFPHVVEPSAGVDRGALALLCEAYSRDESRASPEFMNFHPRIAPIKAGVFPLVAKEGMPEVAANLHESLRRKFPCQIDVKQSIGKRYARMDEAGTPYCITVDGQTLQDQTVTVRDRDTAGQERVNLDQVERYLAEKVGTS